MADEVRFDIKVEVENAVQQLKKIADTSETGAEAVKRLSMFLAKMSKETKIPLEQLRKTLEGINKELTKKTGAGLFSGLEIGDSGIFKAVKGYNDAAISSGRFATTQQGVVTSVNKASKAMEEADKKARGFGHGIDVIRTALGTLLAVGIFQFLNLISGAFTQLLHNVRETELAIYNLINAEKRLSEEGIDVTPKGLQETIDSVRELVPVLSQIQAEELVSRIATNVAPALKLTNEQIKQMAEATALLYVRNKALGKSFDEVESQLTNAFLTGKVSQGINNLGVKISDQIVRDEALRLGLVKTEKQFDSLTGEMEAQIKAAAMLSVVYKNATQDVGSIGEYMETADAQISRVSKTWSDLLTVLGVSFGPAIAQAMEMVAHTLEVVIALVEKAKPLVMDFIATAVGLADSLRGLQISNPGQFFAVLANPDFLVRLQQNIQKAKDSFKDLGSAIDTPTAAVENLGEAVDSLDVDGLREKIEDILSDTNNAYEDLQENLTRKLSDLDEEYRRKAVDAETDYRRKVEDINRDAERDLAKLKDDHREEDLRDEEKYQLALWELRMRFLMDLEDALHARDARQVIRLQKQYEIDKEALARKKELEDKAREENQQNQIEEIERRRQERLEDAKLEYEQRLADQRIAKARELEDLQTWYMREITDLQEAQRRKMETLLKGWMDEQKITAENAAEVYAILASYFGPGGMTDALYKYMMDSLIASTQNAVTAAAGIIGTIGRQPITGDTRTPSPGGGRGPITGGRPSPRAEGGTLIATRPTSVTFGERGPEAATFTPLNRIGRNEGQIDVVGGGGGGGVNGQIVLDLILSPDLEARVVENSMNGVAEVITRINRTKV